MGEAVAAGGYNWYPIVTAGGVKGYVRDDCATVISSTGSSGGTGSVTITNAYQFIKLPADTPAYVELWTASWAISIRENSVSTRTMIFPLASSR